MVEQYLMDRQIWIGKEKDVSERSWDDLVRLYENIRPKEEDDENDYIREIANRMLNLVVQIQKHPKLAKCIPGSAHDVLTIRPVGTRSAVHVVWSEIGYSVSIDPFANTDPSQQKRVLASPDEVITVLEDYVKYLEG